MTPRPRRRVLWAHFVIAAMALAAACDLGGSGEGGCIRIHQGDYTFPVKRIVKDALRVRVTQTGVDTLTEQIKALALALFDADEHGNVVLTEEDLETFLGDVNLSTSLGPFSGGLRDLELTFDLASLEVEFIPGSDPARIRISATNVEVGFSAYVTGEVSGVTDIACGLGSGPNGYVTLLSFVLELELATALDGTLDIEVVKLEIDTQDLDLDVVTDCSQPECSDGISGCSECEIVCGAGSIVADLAGLFQSILDDFIDWVLNLVADDVANLVLQLFLNGQPIAVEGTLDIAKLGAPLLPYLGGAQPLGILGRPAGDGFKITGSVGTAGLDVTLDAGVDAGTAHPCVGDFGGEPVYVAGYFSSFPETVEGPDGTPQSYDIGLSVSEAIVNESVWAAFKAGALCIDVSSGELEELTGGKLKLTAGALDLLLPGLASITGPDAPIRIRIRPKLSTETPPPVIFGDGDESPTIKLQLDDATIAIEALVGDHFLRLLSFRADLEAGVAVDALPGAKLGLRVAGVEIDELTLPDNEIFAAARMDLIVPFVVDLVLGLLDQIPLELELSTAGLTSDFLGVPLEPVIRSIGEAGEDGDWLQVLIAFEEPPARLPMRIRPELAVVEVLPGRVTLAGGVPKGHELQLRVSGGSWSGWYTGRGPIVFEHPRLWLLGNHHLEARLRKAGGVPDEPIPAGEVEVKQPPPADAEPTAAPQGQPPPSAEEAIDGDCAGGRGATGLWLLGGLALVWWLRRRVLWLLALAGITLSGPGCPDIDPARVTCGYHDECPGGYFCSPDGFCEIAVPCDSASDCCPGSECFNGWCRPTAECDADRPCEGLAETCRDGRCEPMECDADEDCPGWLRCAADRCVDGAPCGGPCPDGSACHPDSGRCLETPACTQQCEPGRVLVVSAEAPITPLVCVGASLPCECAALPAVSPGTPGVDLRIVPTPGVPTLLSYDPVYGDLVHSRPTLDLQSRTDTVLDGVPDAAPASPITDYRGGVAEPGPDRGRRPAVALRTDPSGSEVVDVIYRDKDTGGARYLRVRPASGLVEASMELPVAGVAGRYSCLMPGEGGRPTGLVFVERDLPDFFSRLVRVRAKVASPMVREDWEVATVLETPLPPRAERPCDDACSPLELCVRVDGETDACASLLDGLSCPDRCPAHQVCAVFGEEAEPACLPRVYRRSDVDRLPFGAGLFVSCAAGPAGAVAAWYDADHGTLWAAEEPFVAAPMEIVDGTPEAWDGPDVGRHARIAVSANGRQGIAYQDATAESLKFAERGGMGISWELTTVHEGTVKGGSHDLGAWAAVVWDGEEQPVISYADATRANVLLAGRTTDGCWKTDEPLSAGGYVQPDLIDMPGPDVVLGALRYSFDEQLVAKHTLVLMRVVAPKCAAH